MKFLNMAAAAVTLTKFKTTTRYVHMLMARIESFQIRMIKEGDIKSVWLDVSIFLPRHLVLSPTLSSHNLVTNTMRTLSLSATNKTKQYPGPC